jgi:hypothetical protein
MHSDDAPPDDPPADGFLRDESELDAFLSKVRSDPAKGGAPDSEPERDGADEVRVDVEQARVAEEVAAASAGGPASRRDGGPGGASGFWGEGFEPATEERPAGAEDLPSVEVETEGAGDAGLEAKLEALERAEPSES